MIAQVTSRTHDALMKAREMMQSDDPEKVMFICFAARQFQWKSWCYPFVWVVYTCGPTRIWAAAVSAVGELAQFIIGTVCLSNVVGCRSRCTTSG